MKCHYLFLSTCYLILVVGCTTQPIKQKSRQNVNNVSQADNYMQTGQHKKAAKLYQVLAQSKPAQKNKFNLLAIEALIRSSDIQATQAQIRLINPALLSPKQRNRLKLYKGQINLSNGEAEQALTELKNIKPYALKKDDQIYYFQSLAFAYSLTGNRLQSAHARILLNPLLDKNQQQENSQVIFNTLNVLSSQTLSHEQISKTGDLAGWMVLTRIFKIPRLKQNSDELQSYLEEWKRLYPTHPANSGFIENYVNELSQKTELPKAIALLLPESGRYAVAATVIKEGFMAAYNYSETGFNPVLRFYDTELTSPDILYQQAIQEGAELIIGPLSKKNIQTLTLDTELTIPVLALNHIPDLIKDNLFQFGLSPIDEALQIATKARLAGHENMLLYTPETHQGNRMANYISETWQQPEEMILKSVSFNPKNTDFTESIKALLNLNESKQRFKQLKRLLGGNIQFTERRRKDIDGIFLSARSKNARSIYPQLRFYRATRLPVYATPEIYSGRPQPSLDSDLNNITFCDIPWLFPSIDSGELSKQALKDRWQPYPAKYIRLMALGLDSYNIISQLNQLAVTPYFGASGKLSINEENRITRQLVCAKFIKGKPVLQTPLYEESAIEDLSPESSFDYFNP